LTVYGFDTDIIVKQQTYKIKETQIMDALSCSSMFGLHVGYFLNFVTEYDTLFREIQFLKGKYVVHL
jgi:hypothetical protein